MLPVIMSGGCGERLWPMSRTNMPKQFSNFLGSSLLQMTISRLSKINKKPIVISVEEQKYYIKNNFKNNVISLIEPEPKNTAPAIALLCKYLEINNQTNEVIGIFPADHYIENEDIFHKALEMATDEALNGNLVTLGLKPTYAATGFGYLDLDTVTEFSPSKVNSFKEKPDSSLAKKYLEGGNYCWNAGIFIFKASKMIELFQEHQPELWQTFKKLKNDFSNLNEIYKSIKSISIDYAIMEKCKNLKCIPCDMGWMDLGSWEAISDIERQGLISLKGDKSKTELINSNNNFSYSETKKHHCLIDVDDLVIIDTPEALLVSKKGSSAKVKSIVEKLKSDTSSDFLKHTIEYRPWGKFELLAKEDNFQFKKITIMPGERLSYQSHSKRAEHWVIIQGTAKLTLNDNITDLKTGEHVFIPIGDKHRIENNGSEELIFVEVQTGSSFSEEDIIRYSDDYGRLLS